MRRARLFAAIVASSLAGVIWFAPIARADTVVLKDGTSLTGKVTKQVPGKMVVIETPSGAETIPWDEVKRVSLDSDAAAGATQAPTTTPPPTATTAPPPPSTTTAPPTVTPETTTAPETTPATTDGASKAAAFEIGARAGYGIPSGDAEGNIKYGDIATGMIPFIADIGVRINRAIFVGGYFQYAIMNIKGGGTICPNGASDCNGSVIRAGVEVLYHFSPDQQIDPWIGAGLGYEWGNFSVTGRNGTASLKADLTEKGLEMFNLQAGFDYMASPKFGIGPFAMVTFAKYDSAELTYTASGGATAPPGRSGDIQNTSGHNWFIFGLRGAFQVQ